MALSATTRGWSIDPFSELRRMQAEMDRVLRGFEAPAALEFPPVNLWTSPEGLVVMARLPGVAKDDLELTVQNDILTIRGTRRGAEEPRDDDEIVYQRRERPVGAFARSITLPYEVEGESAEAMFSDGVLAIRLVRPESTKPKQIRISAE